MVAKIRQKLLTVTDCKLVNLLQQEIVNGEFSSGKNPFEIKQP